MAKSSLSKSQPTAPQKPAKTIPAAVVLCNADKQLNQIERHLEAVNSVLVLIDEGDDWGHALSFAVQALQTEVQDVRNYLNRMVIKGGAGGEALGIEEGGTR